MDAVILDNIDKSFGPVPAVNGLSARIPGGAVYGFLGPNGAGKTTTLRMIMDIIQPDKGNIEVLGNRSVQAVKARIGYMPEERGLYRKMTVAKVLTYFASIKGMGGPSLALSVGDWLERVDLADCANKRVEELSRGMHQKLQFAVTAVNDPDLLILDEPFSGLDPLNTDLLKGIICEMKDQGKSVIFSTHVMHEAEKLCDSILLINQGRVVLDDSLAHMRSQYRANGVRIEFSGDVEAVRRLPMVQAVQAEGEGLDIMLHEPGDTQALLRALLDQGHVHSFKIKVPSLHDVFVNLVGNHAQDH